MNMPIHLILTSTVCAIGTHTESLLTDFKIRTGAIVTAKYWNTQRLGLGTSIRNLKRNCTFFNMPNEDNPNGY